MFQRNILISGNCFLTSASWFPLVVVDESHVTRLLDLSALAERRTRRHRSRVFPTQRASESAASALASVTVICGARDSLFSCRHRQDLCWCYRLFHHQMPPSKIGKLAACVRLIFSWVLCRRERSVLTCNPALLCTFWPQFFRIPPTSLHCVIWQWVGVRSVHFSLAPSWEISSAFQVMSTNLFSAFKTVTVQFSCKSFSFFSIPKLR